LGSKSTANILIATGFDLNFITENLPFYLLTPEAYRLFCLRGWILHGHVVFFVDAMGLALVG